MSKCMCRYDERNYLGARLLQLIEYSFEFYENVTTHLFIIIRTKRRGSGSPPHTFGAPLTYVRNAVRRSALSVQMSVYSVDTAEVCRGLSESVPVHKPRLLFQQNFVETKFISV